MQEMTSLASLASEINAQAKLADSLARKAIDHAVKAGLISEIHARIFENDPLTLCAQLLNRRVEK